jgi:long-chain acyl-CoA synthetase
LFIKSSDKPALLSQETSVSYNELLRHINFYSTLYNSSDTSKVAIYSGNRFEWVYAFYSAWKNRAIAVPIDFLAQPDEIAYILNDCKPEVLFCSRDTAETMKEVTPLLSYDIRMFVFEDLEHNAADYAVEEIAESHMHQTAVIIYTSGTTGSPKGVMLSCDNLLANLISVSKEVPIYTSERTLLCLLPLHHIFPLLGSMVAPLYVESRMAFSPSVNSADIIDTLQRHKVGIIIGVPRLYEAIRNGIMEKINKRFVAKMIFKVARVLGSRKFSKTVFKAVHDQFGGNLDYLVCGGAKLNEDLGHDYKALGFEILEGFGMTETAPMITFTRPGDWKIGSAGKLLPGVDFKVVNHEILVRGRNVTAGYYGKPEETAKVIKDGWLSTGDTGYIDKRGYVYITGRTKEIIVLSNGKNINPEEVEHKIKGISDYIAEVAVFSKNDQLQAIICPDFKKLREKSILNLEEMFKVEVIEKYNRTSSSYKKITKLYLSKEELPKTRLGKIQRFKLADLAEKGTTGKKRFKKEPVFEEYVIIKEFLEGQKKSKIFPDDHLEIDLALDSLDKISLQVFLESTFGIKVHEDTLIHHSTVEKLSQYMKEKKNKIAVETVRWAEIFKEKVDLKLPESWFTQNLFKNTARYFLKLYFRIRGEGTENIPEGSFIIASNHQSFLDALFVSIFLKNKVFKKTYFYAKEKHVKNILVKTLASKNNVIVMDINKDLKTSLQKLAEVLRNGKNLIIFPEGTRSHTGVLGEFKKSFAILSKELNIPIVPVSISGAMYALPKGSLIPRPFKRIKVTFLKPVYPGPNDYDALTDIVFQKIADELR